MQPVFAPLPVPGPGNDYTLTSQVLLYAIYRCGTDVIPVALEGYTTCVLSVPQGIPPEQAFACFASPPSSTTCRTAAFNCCCTRWESIVVLAAQVCVEMKIIHRRRFGCSPSGPVPFCPARRPNSGIGCMQCLRGVLRSHDACPRRRVSLSLGGNRSEGQTDDAKPEPRSNRAGRGAHLTPNPLGNPSSLRNRDVTQPTRTRELFPKERAFGPGSKYNYNDIERICF